MATRVMVTLQDAVYSRVAHLAQLTSRDVADLVAETVTLALEPLAVATGALPSVTSLSDAEVVARTALSWAGLRPYGYTIRLPRRAD